MGILDDAIREHLELKRQHGAGDSELEQLEGEAFGPSERPGSEGGSNVAAEAPTEFMTAPEAVEGQAPEQADLEGSSSPADVKPAEPAEPPRSRSESTPALADLQEAPESEPDEPAEEEAPAMEHEAIPEPAVSQKSPSTEEREAIADPPTELYDVEGEEFGVKAEAPSDEELVDEEIAEPRLAPAADPLSVVEGANALEEDDGRDFAVTETPDEDEDDFFDEKRLSDELDQALDAPLDVSSEPEPVAKQEPEPEDEPESEELPAHKPEDVLEETPDFLEEAPEDDELWFEQKPPKDFDFDD